MLSKTIVILFSEQTMSGCSERHFQAFDSINSAIKRRDAEIELVKKILGETKRSDCAVPNGTAIRLEAEDVSVTLEVRVLKVQDR